ncbi:MAG: hypothetical protein JO317_08030 [Verrucomicrobiae bacterium]|nr:hypothetical protein [Verrucomicrobiae bacterium]
MNERAHDSEVEARRKELSDADPRTLRVVDGFELSPDHRALLKPGCRHVDSEDRAHVLPRFFYEVESWDFAKNVRVAPHFRLAELMTVDCREAVLLLKKLPHYVPCAVAVLARYLEMFRERVNAPVYVSANGGYRSPSHLLSRRASPHNWGAAADIYRVGDAYLESRESIEKYGEIARSLGPEIETKPYGHGPGETDDHLHFEIGYVTLVPSRASESENEAEEAHGGS